jgi:hypothetical protein
MVLVDLFTSKIILLYAQSSIDEGPGGLLCIHEILGGIKLFIAPTFIGSMLEQNCLVLLSQLPSRAKWIWFPKALRSLGRTQEAILPRRW